MSIAATLLLVAASGALAPRAHVVADPENGDEQRALGELFAAYWREYLELFPYTSSSIGDHSRDDRLENSISESHRAAQRELHERWLARALEVEREDLDAETAFELELFVHQRRSDLADLAWPDHLMPLNQLDCLPLQFAQMGRGASVHPFETVRDYDNFLARIDDFEAWVETAIANMTEGMERGIVQPRIVVRRTIERLRELLPEEPGASPFLEVVRDLPASFPAEESERLTAAYRSAAEERLTPLYRALIDFLEQEYLPACRDSLAWTDLPDGRAWYEHFVRRYTTTDLSPEALFELGEREAQRIGAALRHARERAAEEPATVYETPAEAAAAYAELLRAVEGRVGALFDVAPVTPLEIRATEHGTYYEPGAPDGSRAGVYYFEASGPTRISEATFAHEAIPGHHYQIMLQRESPQPAFRSNYLYFAFIEGWGLYAESLGGVLGLYEDPHQEVGRLESELWRALRLVWDVGLHAKGWSLERCGEYAASFGIAGGGLLRSELERYVAWPAQALSYKAGELRIRALRECARVALGERYDARAFHALVLRTGAVPLDLLEQRVTAWILEQLASGDGESPAEAR